MATASTASSDVELCGWGCAMCTFENERDADACAICLTPRRATPVKSATTAGTLHSSSSHTRVAVSSSSPSGSNTALCSTTTESSAKKQRSSSTTATAARRTIQKPLVAVGSSSEKEALRLKKKVEQMKELGIELPANEMLALLARNCYSVMVAASAYFEQLAAGDAASNEMDAETERRVAAARTHFESSSFAREPFRLVGSRTMSAALNRAGVAMRVGDRLVLQAENAGKKRLRVGVGGSSGSGSGGSDTSGASTIAASALSGGIVRVANEHNSLIGRLDRDMETIFQPLMKQGLVLLGGVCQSVPASSQMFASFNVLVFVFVHAKAFAIFDEAHAQFHLSDALYAALEMVHVESSGAQAAATAATSSSSSSSDDKDAGLEALFSDFIGSGADSDDDGDGSDNGDSRGSDAKGAAAGNIHPADQLAPLLKDITLRSHQRAALRWMLARENQLLASCRAKSEQSGASDAQDEINPMWEMRTFAGGSARSYFVNRFEKIASLQRPQPPTPCLGGILADDMGMGKTMMMLALIAHQKHFGAAAAGADAESSAHVTASPTPFALRSTRASSSQQQQTLIVCPLSLLHQWKNEVDERFRASALRVHVYYGDDRESNGAIAKSDIVLTTYGVLSKEFERPDGGSSSMLIARAWQRVILDEAHSIKNRATTYFRACATLRATRRWCLTGTPLQNALDDLFALLCFLQYEPWSRLSWWKRVIATPFEQGDEANALGRLKVVLTPILLRRTKHTRDRHGKRLVDLPPKHVELVRLTFSPEERAFYQAVYDKSRAEFNGFVASGTANTSYVAIFALLLRLRQACDHPLLALGRNFEQTQAQAAASGSGAAGSDAASNSGDASAASLFRPQTSESMEAYYARISTQLQQDLQQSSSSVVTAAVASADAADGSRARGLTKSYIASVLAQVEEGLESHECPVCLDPPVNGVLTACAHVLCEQCLRDSIASDPESGCPVCRAVVDMTKVFVLPTPAPRAVSEGGDDDASTVATTGSDEIETERRGAETERHAASSCDDDSEDNAATTSGGVFLSTKLQQLLRDLTRIRRENRQQAASASVEAGDDAHQHRSQQQQKKRKVVVFSQWTHMLEMVATLLHAHGFAHCIFHGSMNQETRERVLTRFAKDPALDVLVISLKAGGVGLNLTCASVVILLDPWWNPGVEDQAIDRVHRLGQDQDVVVKRYVVDDTVEDMILQLQQRKETLAKHVLVAAKGGDDKRSERLSLEDLKSFFR